MLLDSNILIYGASGSHASLDAILDRRDLAVASLTRIETLGFHRLSELERRWLEAAFAAMRVLPLDPEVENQAIALRQAQRMALADAVIAATALVHHLPLVTRNVSDFLRVPDLAIINPFENNP